MNGSADDTCRRCGAGVTPYEYPSDDDEFSSSWRSDDEGETVTQEDEGSSCKAQRSAAASIERDAVPEDALAVVVRCCGAAGSARLEIASRKLVESVRRVGVDLSSTSRTFTLSELGRIQKLRAVTGVRCIGDGASSWEASAVAGDHAGYADGRALEEAVFWSSPRDPLGLRVLDLSRCFLAAESLALVCRSLRRDGCGLETLKLRACGIGPTGASSLVSALGAAGPASRLRLLDVRENPNMDTRFLEVSHTLADVVVDRTSITTFNGLVLRGDPTTLTVTTSYVDSAALFAVVAKLVERSRIRSLRIDVVAADAPPSYSPTRDSPVWYSCGLVKLANALLARVEPACHVDVNCSKLADYMSAVKKKKRPQGFTSVTDHPANYDVSVTQPPLEPQPTED